MPEAKKKINLFLLFLLTCAFHMHCTNKLVLSELVNSRLGYILKGTYESNDPHDWRSQLYLNDYVLTSVIPSSLRGNILTGNGDEDFKIYLDIAEIALSPLVLDNDINSDNLNFFSLTRQLLCPTYDSARNRKLRLCEANSGIQKLNDFFEEGIKITSSDIEVADYKSVTLFPRRLVTYPSMIYTDAGGVEDSQSSFDNDRINGFNIPEIYEFSFTDRTNEVVSRIFPLRNNEIDIRLRNTEKPFIIEVRIFLKNLMMVHIAQDGSMNADNRNHLFIGPSDWSANHRYNDTSQPNGEAPAAQYRLGGNLLIIARMYEPHNVSTLEVANSGSCSGGIAYYALVPKETFNSNKLPLGATAFDANASIKNIPPGEYDLYVTQDDKWHTNSGEVPGEDGFPESSRLCASLTLGESETRQMPINCPCP